MLREQVKIINKLGLHTRAAAKLVSVAAKFESKIELIRDKQTANCKSIMSIILLGVTKNVVLELVIAGADERDARDAIVALIQDRFGEKE